MYDYDCVTTTKQYSTPIVTNYFIRRKHYSEIMFTVSNLVARAYVEEKRNEALNMGKSSGLYSTIDGETVSDVEKGAVAKVPSRATFARNFHLATDTSNCPLLDCCKTDTDDNHDDIEKSLQTNPTLFDQSSNGDCSHHGELPYGPAVVPWEPSIGIGEAGWLVDTTVRESTIERAGRGRFASKNIRAGDVIRLARITKIDESRPIDRRLLHAPDRILQVLTPNAYHMLLMHTEKTSRSSPTLFLPTRTTREL